MPVKTDKVQLAVGGFVVDDFESYSLESDLFTAADAFTFDIKGGPTFIAQGKPATVSINNALELTGNIDSIARSYTKDSNKISVSGRDMMGLICDHCCEDFGEKYSLNGKTLRQVATHLISQVPMIQRKSLMFQKGCSGFDTAQTFGKIDVGNTVFDVISRCSCDRGLLFYALPDGTFVIGKPKDIGTKPLFSIVCRKDGVGNNVISGTQTLDISQAYSRVTVVGQIQRENEDGTEETEGDNVHATAVMPDNLVPFPKPMVCAHNGAKVAPARWAQRLVDQQRSKMNAIDYTVPGHSQNGHNWAVNELVHVEDELFVNDKGGILKGDFLIRGRVFKQSKEDGQTTDLKLCLPGLVMEA